MKKIFISILLILLLSSVSYGAVSEDVYVRKDVFDAKMEALFSRLHGEIETLSAEFKALGNEIKGDIRALDTRLTGMENTLNARISGIENHASWWIAGLTLVLTAIALIPLILKFFDKLLERREEKRKTVQPSFTLEDVKRLIAEAKLNTTTQI